MKKQTMILLALIACILWASAFPTIKALYAEVNIGSSVGAKLLLAGMRFTLSGILILGFYAIRHKKFPSLVKGRIRLEVTLLGLIQTGMLYLMFYIGVYNTTGMKSAILTQVSIFMVVVMSHFIYHDDKMHRGKIAGLVMGLIGIIIVNIGGLSTAEGLFNFSMTGEGFLILAGVFSTMGTFYVKRLSKAVNPVLLNGWQMMLGGMMLLIAGILTSEGALKMVTLEAYLLFGYLVLISSGAFSLWFILLQKNKASELAMVRFTIPIMGSVFSAIFIPGEDFTVMILVALGLVAFGIYQCNKG